MNSDWQWLVAIYPDYRTDADSVGALSQGTHTRIPKYDLVGRALTTWVG